MRTKFENKLKSQMIRDEIKNKIQLEIINVNKTIANKRRETESKEKSILQFYTLLWQFLTLDKPW